MFGVFATDFVVRALIDFVGDLHSDSFEDSPALYFLAAFGKSLRAALAFDGETIATKE